MEGETMNTPSEDMKNVNLQSTKLKKRLTKVLDDLTQHPAASILSASGNRA